MGESVATPVGDLAVDIRGDAGRPWLILAGSLASDMSMWDAQIDALSRQYRVLRYDQPGHGRSGPPGARFAMDDMADAVTAVMAHYTIDKADFIGLSFGGMTGLGLALRHPERLRRLVCACARSDFPPAAVQGWDDRAAAARGGGMASVVEGTLDRWYTPSVPAQVREHGRRMILETPVEGFVAAIEAIKRVSYRGALSDIRTPTLYLAGDLDEAAPAAEMQAMAAATPAARFIRQAGVAHLANMEDPAGFLNSVTDFLKEETS